MAAPHPCQRSAYCYTRGCRNVECTEANTIAMQIKRENAWQRIPPDHVHGTLTGYDYWGCRCDLCKTIKSTHNATRKRYRTRSI